VRLPNCDRAFIQPQKLTGYLLSETHSVGRSKAKRLRAVGFNDENVAMLEQAILQIATSQPVKDAIDTPHGVKYVIEGTIATPNRAIIAFRTVWIIDTGETFPRFVTAHPL